MTGTAFDLRAAFNQQRWLECKNVGSQDAPSFGCLEITGYSTVNERLILNVQRPSADGLAQVAFNAIVPLPAGEFGLCTMDYPAVAAYDTGNTPAVGETWGSQTDSFLIGKDNNGLQILGGLESSTVRVAQSGGRLKLAQTGVFSGADTTLSASATALPFNTPTFGDTGEYSIDISNGVVTIQSTGTYLFFYSANIWLRCQAAKYTQVRVEAEVDTGSGWTAESDSISYAHNAHGDDAGGTLPTLELVTATQFFTRSLENGDKVRIVALETAKTATGTTRALGQTHLAIIALI